MAAFTEIPTYSNEQYGNQNICLAVIWDPTYYVEWLVDLFFCFD